MKHFHAHIYWENTDQRNAALSWRNELEKMGGILGSVHDRPVGPHPLPMYQVEYDERSQSVIEDLLKSRAGNMSILLHTDTGNHVEDHTAGVRWIGKSRELDIEFLRALDHD